MKRLSATVHGRVQGVAFRAYTQEQAIQLGVRGWVANQYDGTVRVVATFRDDALQRLLTWLHHGPPAAQVTHVEAVWGEGTGEYQSFQVRY
jgi:acylphosphatase